MTLTEIKMNPSYLRQQEQLSVYDIMSDNGLSNGRRQIITLWQRDGGEEIKYERARQTIC